MKIMKRLWTTLLIALISFVAMAQNDYSSTLEIQNTVVYTTVIPRYKMFESGGIPYSLIKLDTATGRVWQVLFKGGIAESEVVAIDDNSLLSSCEDEIPGRYELHSAPFFCTFVLLDTKKGDTYLVHCSSTDPDQRYRVAL